MTTISLNALTTKAPERWQYLPVRHFDWASVDKTSECEGCGAPANRHIWRVRAADGRVLDCGVAA